MDESGKKAFALRLDAQIHAAIERLAAKDLRSVSAQIEVLLREALKARGLGKEASLALGRDAGEDS